MKVKARESDLGYRRTPPAGRVEVTPPQHPAPLASAVHYLTTHAADLFQQVGDTSWSLAVQATYNGLTISDSALIAGPYVW